MHAPLQPRPEDDRRRAWRSTPPKCSRCAAKAAQVWPSIIEDVRMSFFAPPPTITAEVFTRLPDRFRKPRPTAWATANRGGHAIDPFLEGPVFDRAGRLYVTDIPFGRIFRIDPSG